MSLASSSEKQSDPVSRYIPPHLRRLGLQTAYEPPKQQQQQQQGYQPQQNGTQPPKQTTRIVQQQQQHREYDIPKVESTVIDFDAYEDIPVQTSGRNVPKPIERFVDVGHMLGQSLMDNIQRCNFEKPTPIQRYTISIALTGRDVMACAQTGSGKTAAFCFPIIAEINQVLSSKQTAKGGRGGRTCPLSLILAPTRELAVQIYQELRKFIFMSYIKAAVVYGGAPIREQFRELSYGCDMLVATPGRLTDIMERGRVSMCDIRFLCLDEADRMLDMGFEPQIRRIVEGSDMPPRGQRQTLMFSATFPKEIQRMATDFLHDHVYVAVGRVGSSTDLIVQHMERVDVNDKFDVLIDLLSVVSGLTLVFVETKRSADKLERMLLAKGFEASSIHGDRSQEERERALSNFKYGRTPVLVATDVAARGLDIPRVAHVINFDLPANIDDYVHRIGRTGRAGHKGLATAFFCEGKDEGLAGALMKLMQETNQEVPRWLQAIGAQRRSQTEVNRYMSYGGKGGRFGGRQKQSGKQAQIGFGGMLANSKRGYGFSSGVQGGRRQSNPYDSAWN